MTAYVEVCAVEDMPNGKQRAFTIDGLSILIFRINPDVFALENRCTHLDFPLEGGRQIGSDIICRKHGARFDIRTGNAVVGPAVEPLRRFDARVRGGRIEILPSKPLSRNPFIREAS